MEWLTIFPPLDDVDNLPASYVGSDIALDQDFTWGTNYTDERSRYSLNAGIDFAVKIGKIDFHLGGLLGMLATAQKGSNRIQNNTLSISAAYDMKGR